MKNITLLLCFLFSMLFSFGQQHYTSSLYNINGYNINPGYAGLTNFFEGNLQYKKQWVGVENSPINGLIQAQGQLSESFGLGLNADYWTAASLSSTNIGLTGAYHLKIGIDSKLSFGVTGGYHQFTFDASKIIAFDQEDILSSQKLSNGGLYLDGGLLYSNKKLKLGFSVPRLLNSDLEFKSNNQSSNLLVQQQLLVQLQYDFVINSKLDIIPSVLYRKTKGFAQNIDFMARGVYQKRIGLSLGFRTLSGVMASFDLKVSDRLRFAYSYDFGMSNLSGISGGSHELMLGFVIGKEKLVKQGAEERFYVLQIASADTTNKLDSAKVSITNKQTGVVTKLETRLGDVAMVKIDSNTNYDVMVVLVNHEPYITTFTTLGTLDSDKIANVVLKLKKKVIPVIPVVQEVAVAGENSPESVDSVAERTVVIDKSRSEEKPAIPLSLKSVYFELSQSTLSAETKEELNFFVKLMNSYPELKIALRAYTDCTGPDLGNEKLSEQRAEVCVQYIQSRISNPERISGQGKGEKRANGKCSDQSEQQHRLNRVAEFVIVK